MNSNILHWSYRDFREFPRELIEYGDRVEEIYLKENFIPTIPLWLFDFNHLKFIHLSGNALEIIPDEISTLVNLEYLNVSRNHIKRLPKSIASMKKLQYLNVSENEIDTLHKEIGSMPSLETLDACGNRLTKIPVQLSASKSLKELFFSDNYFIEIPPKIMSMQCLKVFEAERCCLAYLPGIVGDKLTHIRVFNNTRLTHYPIVYDRFLRLHFDYWSENVVSADLLMIFLPDEHKRTIVPRSVNHITFINEPRRPPSLYELGLRALYADQKYYDTICQQMDDNCFVPKVIQENIINGPICLCGIDSCRSTLFTECHFLLLKKNGSPSHIIFSNMFCSKDCMSKWSNENRNKYHSIDWTVM